MILEALTQELEFPWQANVVGMGAFAIVGIWFVYSFNASKEAETTCFLKAHKWASSEARGGQHNPQNYEYFAIELATARLACPTGHPLINENTISLPIKELSSDPRLVSFAKRAQEVETLERSKLR